MLSKLGLVCFLVATTACASAPSTEEEGESGAALSGGTAASHEGDGTLPSKVLCSVAIDERTIARVVQLQDGDCEQMSIDTYSGTGTSTGWCAKCGCATSWCAALKAKSGS